MDLSNENIVHVKKGNIEYLQFKKLLDYGILNAYTIGKNIGFKANDASGNIIKEKEEKVIKDYEKVCNALGENYNKIVKPIQKHTDNIQIIENKINADMPDINCKEYNNIDGLITNKKDIILATTSADCITLLFFDPVKKVIANVHSGWKGTLQRISIKAVEKMVEKYGSKYYDIICCICPSIRRCHFEVKEDVEKLFEEEFKDLNLEEIIINKEPNKSWYIDTVLINKIILERKGLKQENIIDSNICTVCNKDLMHSYRAEKELYNVNTALIEIKE